MDTCDIRRLDVRGAINTATLQYSNESEPDVASGQSCLFRPKTTTPEVSEFGQQGVGFLEAEVYLPHDAPELEVEDTIVLTASVSNAQLVGKEWRVTAVHFDSYKNRQMVEVDRAQGPGENTDP